jgi:drug/metabolite transporter (DMT)-like permease
MTVGIASAPAPQSRGVQGITCIVAGMAIFVVQDAMMKVLLGEFTLWMLLFVRGVVALIILVPVILYLGRPHRLITPLWPLHLTRACLFVAGFSLFYTAFPFMGLAEVTTIFFSAPLIIALLATLFLGEPIGPHRIGALIVGFAGVVYAMNPGGEGFDWIAILPLLCAFAYATSQILAHKIGDRETTLTTGLYTVSIAGLLMIPTGWIVNQLITVDETFMHIQWRWPDVSLSLQTASQLWPVIVLGAIGMGGIMLLTRAYQIAPASLVAPFDYAYLPMAAMLAYVVWGEVPTQQTLIGMALIIGSGLYIGYRELVSERSELEPRPIAEASVAPGNPVAPIPASADIDATWETHDHQG